MAKYKTNTLAAAKPFNLKKAITKVFVFIIIFGFILTTLSSFVFSLIR